MSHNHSSWNLGRSREGGNHDSSTGGSGPPFESPGPRSCSPSVASPQSLSAQGRSGPSTYNGQESMPYWDDGSGAILTLPVSPSRTKDRPQWRERSRKPASGRKSDFMPYLDPEDARNTDELESTVERAEESAALRPALGNKHVNQKLGPAAVDNLGTATTARNADSTEQRLESHILPWPTLGLTGRTATKFDAEAFPELPYAAAKDAHPMSTLIEEPSPLRIIKVKISRAATEKVASSPTLQKIRKLRAEEQTRTLARLQRELVEATIQDTHETGSQDVDIFSSQTVASTDFEDHRLVNVQRGESVPEGLDLEKIAAAKENQARRPSLRGSAASVDSVVSAKSEDFERVSTPTGSEMERNGSRRKWYKFRSK